MCSYFSILAGFMGSGFSWARPAANDVSRVGVKGSGPIGIGRRGARLPSEDNVFRSRIVMYAHCSY